MKLFEDQDTDVLVIGGGAIGICCAYYLARAGRRVTVIERDQIGSGASSSHAGLVVANQCIPLAAPGVIRAGLKWMLDAESPFYIRPQMDLSFLSWLWQFSRRCTAAHVRRAIPVLRDLQRKSITLFGELAAEGGNDFGFQTGGILDAYRDPRQFAGACQTASVLRDFGLQNRILQRDDVADLFPLMRTRLIGGVLYPRDGHVDPEGFVYTMAARAAENGVACLTRTEVIGLRRSGRRITAVETTGGRFIAKDVILAGGAWSPRIGRQVGLKLSVQPAKGYAVVYRRPKGIPDIPVLLAESKVAITPSNDELRFAGTLELSGLDPAFDRRRIYGILKAVPRYLPEIHVEDLELLDVRLGFRPCTPDGLPYVGRPRGIDNLIVATGHGMKGISLAPVTGLLVARLTDGAPSNADLSALRVERFESPAQ